MSTTQMETTPATRWSRTITLAVILGCQLMMVLDTSIVTTALPHLERELGFNSTTLSWVQNSYALAFGGLLLLGARVGDLLGRRRVFMVGVGVFTFASLLAGVAFNAEVMIGARVLQGAASAFAIPATLALLVQTFPEPGERSQAISIYSAVIGAGGSVGIIVGGVFTDLLSWRWGLLINVPIGIVVLLLSPRFLPETGRVKGSVDIPGALTVTAGMSALVYGLVNAGEAGWGNLTTIVSLAAAVLLLLAFVLVERHAGRPITPLRLFKDMTRSGAYIIRILIVGAMFSTFYFLSQYLQNVLGFSAFAAGIAYIPLTLLFFLMVYVIKPLSALLGKPALLVVSLVIAGLGMLWLSAMGPGTAYFPDVLLPLIVLGIGQGTAIILLTEFGMSGVAPADNGAASGLVNTAHQLGGSIGLALLTVVFAGSGGTAEGTAGAEAYGAVFTCATWFYALAVPCAALIYLAQRSAAGSASATRP
ncbi:EmrB/QacA subfamily drug resistance transporter [Paenarthrobacter nitroguajacolicus]|uniref:MFS transporter n=1 Tax=Paenarthrobacter nitroguajacolicus TaxID=211146 RepID=UPI00285B8F27|nr:MFS transporter [Paenarthrobacter nitroguajacolicus]MDR6986497.1 EmrB/QacA subfamily drug resistance transporter [Paenarthrobacter nitroguajacolicus]